MENKNMKVLYCADSEVVTNAIENGKATREVLGDDVVGYYFGCIPDKVLSEIRYEMDNITNEFLLVASTTHSLQEMQSEMKKGFFRVTADETKDVDLNCNATEVDNLCSTIRKWLDDYGSLYHAVTRTDYPNGEYFAQLRTNQYVQNLRYVSKEMYSLCREIEDRWEAEKERIECRIGESLREQDRLISQLEKLEQKVLVFKSKIQ